MMDAATLYQIEKEKRAARLSAPAPAMREAPASVTLDRRAYWRAYYRANREKKIAQAMASYFRNRDAA